MLYDSCYHQIIIKLRERMLAKIFTLIILCLIWIGLIGWSNDINKIFFLIIVPIISYSFANYIQVIPKTFKFKPKFILYCAWLIIEILKSTFRVIKIIWRKDLNLKSVFEWVDFDQACDTHLVVYGNSITLTPGTFTADIKNTMLLVHALEESSIQDLKTCDMSNRIKAATC